MQTLDLRAAVADERRRVADLVESLDAAQLDTPSLCAGWTVRDVIGHLVAAVDVHPAALLALTVRSGLRPHRANAELARRTARRSPAQLAIALRRHAERAGGVPLPNQLADLQMHGQDVRRPLGLPHGLHGARLRATLDFLVGGRAYGFTRRGWRAGLRLRAADLDWAAGDGAEVGGPAEALMMALGGRSAALADLTGPGVAVLRSRLPG